ncbi:MAG: hypothetical protein A2Y57_00325 [Candidatus Woykebacteria bacterium RBG_13_40_7b]|uniref:Uncharacterized protein n=1 Tax=Candidatus Woykebacteria bacterium RBG_13_40_7b TaxID=1802594 RepID=A0A1G1WAG5_9BACT|nr:MAG: hypothetical protein A2Y57_00325 [Candidatus Woykebacteria bacterium RBG_13_40_7b]
MKKIFFFFLIFSLLSFISYLLPTTSYADHPPPCTSGEVEVESEPYNPSGPSVCTNIWTAPCPSGQVESIDPATDEIACVAPESFFSGGSGDSFFNIFNPTGIKELGGTGLLKVVLTLLLVVAGIAALIFLLIGGIRWIAAGGDPKNLAAARQTIINALIGLIIVVAAYAIAKALEGLFGISIISGLKVF